MLDGYSYSSLRMAHALPPKHRREMQAMLIIRDEIPTDRAAMRTVIEAAFGRQYEADLVDGLRNHRVCEVSLVAVENDDVLGHALFSRMTAPFRALGLAPVSVMPGRQGLGIGSRLIHAGLERARLAGWQGVFVLGDPSYYRRFGFDPSTAATFECRYAGPHLMALALGDALPVTTGRVEYASAFDL
jgi:putative acetyltransferase